MQVVLQSDNAGLVLMLLKEHSRDARLCALLQAIVAVQELYGFRESDCWWDTRRQGSWGSRTTCPGASCRRGAFLHVQGDGTSHGCV